MNISYKPKTDYDKIKHQPGLYWTRGVVPYMKDETWTFVWVTKPFWTRESGKTHCQWFYMDRSGGYEIEKGEWIFVPDPGEIKNV